MMRRFFVIWAGQAASLFGSSLVQFALIWYLTQETKSATVLAMASMVGLLPQILLGPFAGTLVDRWNRRLVLMVSDGAIALATAALALSFMTGHATVWQIYVLLFVRALGSAFQWPAMQASTTLLVPREQLARVGGLNQALQGASSIITPPLGALLLGLLSMPAILAIDVATAALAIGPLFFIAIPQPARSPQAGAPQPGDGPLASARRRTILADTAEGARYLWGFPAMLALCVMGTLIRLLIWPGAAMLPLMVSRYFGGPLQLASLQAAGGIGLLLGGVVMGAWGGFRRRMVTAMLALLIDGVALVMVGVSPSAAQWLGPAWGLGIAVGAFFVSGFVEAAHFAATGAVFQAVVPPALQGRLLGLINSVGTAMVPLGLAIAGPVADVLGVQIWWLIGGVATALMAAGSFCSRAIMRIEDAAPAAEVAPLRRGETAPS